jgi:hypothetical protein
MYKYVPFHIYNLAQEFDGPGMVSRVDDILQMSIDDDDETDYIEYGYVDIGAYVIYMSYIHVCNIHCAYTVYFVYGMHYVRYYMYIWI